MLLLFLLISARIKSQKRYPSIYIETPDSSEVIVLSDYLFIFISSKSWKSVRNSLKKDWKNV